MTTIWILSSLTFPMKGYNELYHTQRHLDTLTSFWQYIYLSTLFTASIWLSIYIKNKSCNCFKLSQKEKAHLSKLSHVHINLAKSIQSFQNLPPLMRTAIMFIFSTGPTSVSVICAAIKQHKHFQRHTWVVFTVRTSLDNSQTFLQCQSTMSSKHTGAQGCRRHFSTSKMKILLL